ncbi:glycosyltransferase [Thermodesulfobacteriota bacterium]
MISVVIPAYNTEKMISACLDALINQTVEPSKYEIIVVDDGSNDNTANVVKSFEGVRLIQQENQGPAAARNIGAQNAKGGIILFTDSDCIPQKNWVEEMVLPFENDPEIVGVKGIYKSEQKELASRFVQMEYEDKYEMLAKDKYIDFVDTNSAAFKKEVFLEFGGYDTAFTAACAEDVELSYRMSSKGYKMVFNPRAIVNHTHPKTFLAYFKKKFKFAYWRILALRKNPIKLIKDSHTPQVMKFQLFFFPFLALSSFFMLFSTKAMFLAIGIITAFIISTIPFTLKTVKKDVAVGLLSPFVLIGRSVVQFFGVLHGTIDHIILRKTQRHPIIPLSSKK